MGTGAAGATTTAAPVGETAEGVVVTAVGVVVTMDGASAAVSRSLLDGAREDSMVGSAALADGAAVAPLLPLLETSWGTSSSLIASNVSSRACEVGLLRLVAISVRAAKSSCSCEGLK